MADHGLPSFDDSDLNHTELDHDILEPIAVIGLSLKFPQEATSTESFWKMLVEGKSAMTEFPSDRFNIDAFYHPDNTRPGTMPVRGGHFVTEDLGAFDAPFFAITPAEAACLDPQQRWLLETSYRALENAGIPMERCVGSKTSVYNGSFTGDYRSLVMSDPEQEVTHAATGLAASMLANRISWFFDFKGPSVNLDTACSSSLMALHTACQGLRDGEASMASSSLVAGSNLIFHPDFMFVMSKMSFLSPDSRCYSFDHRANGYARGEGIGVVVIKRLADALRDGDTVRAIIRSTGANQDGRTPGITQPSGEAQEELIRSTYEKASLNMLHTRYFEAHGTGTSLGDPIEANAVGHCFQRHRTRHDPLYIGAVKSNIGHLEGASGIAGLIKTIMVLEKGVIPPNTNFEKVNPGIDLASLCIRLPLECIPWPSPGLRRASVNSFGFGGSNAHVILDDACHYLRLRNLKGQHCSVQEPPILDPAGSAGSPQYQGSQRVLSTREGEDVESILPKLLILSAADEDGVHRLLKLYQDYLKTRNPSIDAAIVKNLTYTLTARRSHLEWRSYILIRQKADLFGLEANFCRPIRAITLPKVAFIFTGQGAQYAQMGSQLLRYEVFRQSLEEAESFFKTLGCTWSLMTILMESPERSVIDDPEYSQPLCTALQIALIALLQTFNILPSAVLGHSSGEIAAAYCIGALSRTSAWRLAYYRGKVAASLAASHRSCGTMISVAISQQQANLYLGMLGEYYKNIEVSIGCINSPHNVTMTGDVDQIYKLEEWMKKDAVAVHRLRVNVAYHSPQINDIADQYILSIKQIEPGDVTTIPMISSVSGVRVLAEELRHVGYWVRNMVSPVEFLKALTVLCTKMANKRRRLGHVVQHQIDVTDILEIGPHSALRGPIQESLRVIPEGGDIRYHPTLTRHSSAVESMLEVAGQLYCSGFPVNILAADDQNESSPGALLVDLPEYPFNRTQLYWLEGRASKGFRFRQKARSDLLGTPVPDWNYLDAQWRNVIRQGENPWIEDHQIEGVCLYPAAGMLVMAIEAANQVANGFQNGLKISAFQIEDATFSKALRIPSLSKGVETRFHLRPMKGSSDPQRVSSEYLLLVLENENWEECCSGRIRIEYEAFPDEVDGGREAGRIADYYRQVVEDGFKVCNEKMNTTQLYDVLFMAGAHYGPAFKVLTKLIYSNLAMIAAAEIELRQWAVSQKIVYEQPHVIHPTTLDGVFQLIVPAVSHGGKGKLNTMVPTRIKKLWVSNTGLSGSKSSVQAVASCQVKGYRKVESSITAVSITGEPCIILEAVESTFVSDNLQSAGSTSEDNHLCCSIDWKPDLDTLSHEQVLDYCEKSRPERAPPESFYRDLKLLIFFYINDALQKLAQDKPDNMPFHLVRYVEWMRHQVWRYNSGDLQIHQGVWKRLRNDEAFCQSLIHRVEEASNEGKFYAEVGRHLCGILHGRVDPLDLLFKGDLAKAYYEELHGDPATIAPFVTYLDALGHKNPSQAILEIGAGTGGATLPILRALALDESEAGSVRYSRYDFTDISPGFFESARGKFQKYVSKMNFNILDIEKDPSQQGFREQAYDIVIASNVLHATKSLKLALQNTRKLLRPGGKLVLFEVTEPHILRTGFAFGLLKGWWLAVDDSRTWSPMLTAAAWNDALVEAGFSGIDLLLPDHKSPECHESSIMIATAVLESAPAASLLSLVKVVLIAETKTQLSLAGDVRETLIRTQHSDCEILSLDQGAVARLENNSAIHVFLLEIDQIFLSVLNARQYADLQSIICADIDILWVSRDSTSTHTRPDFEMVTGLARALRSEYAQSKFSTLILGNAIETSATSILKVLEATVSSAVEECEPEYRERDGLYEISRIIKAEQLNHTLEAKSAPEKKVHQSCGSTSPVSLNIRTPGLLDSLEFCEDLKSQEPLSVDEVEVVVEATGVNFRDCLLALGQLPDKALGTECAGVVQRCGSQVSVVRSGDRVVVSTMDTYKSLVRAKDLCVAKIPSEMSFVDAASLPTTALTAIHSLCNIARLRSGETILIHNGAGGTGQMAIQISQYLQADIYTTVGSEEKRSLLKDTYGIPEERILFSRNTSFAQGIKRMTQGRGVDVILSSLSGEGLKASWECISPFGRFIEIGKKAIESNGDLPMAHFARNTSFAAVDLAGIIRERPNLLQELLQSMIGLIHSGDLRIAKPIHAFPVSEISQALRYLQSGRNTGKTVIEWKNGVQLPTVLKNSYSCHFSANATYVIAGGLGGLGRSVARWMAGCGARFLILLSRTGPKTEAAAELLVELRSQGVQVEALACDITDNDALRQAFNESSKRMPPVKGCIQSTMVLRDSIFSNMSYSQFIESTRPKVAGSWNLHSLLPRGLDFFILLSSICGIFGAVGQANYGAGNTYKDALAHYRTSQGEKAVSLDLGMMVEEGVVAENNNLMQLLARTGYFIPISQAKLLALLDYYCDPRLPVLSPLHCQLVVGIEIPTILSSRGIDHPYWMRRPLFRHFYQMTSKTAPTGSRNTDPAPDYAALLHAASDAQERAAVVTKAIARKLSLIVGVRSEDIAPSKPIHAYGVDSLIAVEIKSWLMKEVGVDVPIFDILGNDTLASLSLKLAAKSKSQQKT